MKTRPKSEAQWELMQPMLPARKPRGRPPTDRRVILDAILHVVKTGVHWRSLPSDFPPHQTVFHIFRQWAKDNVWEAINARLRGLARKEDGRGCRPTAAILDSQSVKCDPHGGEVGYDAAKKIKGRKRHLLVDTLGLVLAVFITPASTTERDGAKGLLEKALTCFTWLRMLWVDGGYSGKEFAEWARSMSRKLKVEVVKRSDDTSGFKVLPRRWVVERTFGWLMRQRRLVGDHEATEGSAAAWVYVAMMRIQVRRLAKHGGF